MSLPRITEHDTPEQVEEWLKNGSFIYDYENGEELGFFSWDAGRQLFKYTFNGWCEERGLPNMIPATLNHNVLVPVLGECNKWTTKPYEIYFDTLADMAFWAAFVGSEHT